MRDETCPCCSASDIGNPRWIEAVTSPLPEDVAVALGHFLEGEPVQSLEEWATAVRRETDGPIEIDDLCLRTTPSPHFGVIDDKRYDFACCVDAIILGVLDEKSVDITTQSPTGTQIEMCMEGTHITAVHPLDTVFSFGVDETVRTDGSPTLADGYRAICPFVKAFPSIEEYQRWSDETAAPTIAYGPTTAVTLAQHLVQIPDDG